MIGYHQFTDVTKKPQSIEVIVKDKNKTVGTCFGTVYFDEDEVQNWFNTKNITLDEELYLPSLLPVAIVKDLQINNNISYRKYGSDLNEKFVIKVREQNCKAIILEAEIKETSEMSLADWYDSNEFKPIGYANSNPILLRILYH